MKHFVIPKVGARILEGRANALSNQDLGRALADPAASLDTIKAHLRRTVADLGLGTQESGSWQHDRSTNLAIGMSLVAGLMQYEHLRRPGTNFLFTMRPAPDCPVQYRDTPKTHLSQNSQDPHVPIKVPGSATNQEELCLSAVVRSHLSATLLGMNSYEIRKAGISDLGRGGVRKARDRAGMVSTIQLAAHCFVNEAIRVPEEILAVQPPDELTPILYDKPITIALPLGIESSPSNP